jgi:DNA-binding transcriptional LysR family regulator
MEITLRQLRAFAEVVEAGSFTDAARRLNLTQSAVSMLVRDLEAQLGVTLFNREQRPVTATEAGRQILPVAARMIDDQRQLMDGVEDLRALRSGSLRLAVPQILACTWLPDRLHAFHARYPEVSLQVIDTTVDAVAQVVADGAAEIGIGPFRAPPGAVEPRPLWDEPIDLVFPADGLLSDAPAVGWETLSGETWIMYSGDFAMQMQQHALAAGGVRMARQIGVRGLTTALALVGRGMGISAAPRYARAFEPQFGVRLRAIAPARMAQSFQLYVRRGHALSAAARAFAATLPGGVAACR